MKVKKTCLLLLTIVLCVANLAAFAQKDSLNKTPYFIEKGGAVTDSLFARDIAVLKKNIVLDTLDAKILKKSVLIELLYENDSIKEPYTYTKLIQVINAFKKSIGYIELRRGLETYEKMKNLKVNPANWANDQKLFERLGFTEADLEDFKVFISRPENRKLTYKEAYIMYMKEIDALSVDK